MAALSGYYQVMMGVGSSHSEEEQFVGAYTTEPLAARVIEVVRLAFQESVPERFYLRSSFCEGELQKAEEGVRVKEIPTGAITIVQERLSSEEVLRLLTFIPKILGSKLPKPSPLSLAPDKAKFLCEGRIYTVLLEFEPFDGSHRLATGFYLEKKTAQRLSKFIILAYQGEKAGCGFNICIESYQTEWMEHASGKSYIKIGDHHHEIKRLYDHHHLIHISKRIIEAIDTWSRTAG